MQNQTRLLLLSLTLAVFAVITTEVAVIGLLPQLINQLHITATQVGFLVSIYALVVALSGPFITLIFGRFNRKIILLSIMLLFLLSNSLYALTERYEVILLFRILPALTHALFFAVALHLAANTVPPEKSTQGVAIVFSGVAIGMVFGVPLSAFIAETFSPRIAFWFAAIASGLALVGIAFHVPSTQITAPLKVSEQVQILKKGIVWLSMLTVTLIFSAMFAGFSFIADYLINISHFSNNATSTLLIVFGVSGYIGNFIFSHYLQRNAIQTTLIYPLIFALIYFALWLWGSHSLVVIPLVIIWGIFHTSGLIVSQSWLMSKANTAPEFANSLYISFSNLGITIGTMVGGWILQFAGIAAITWAGLIFALLAFISIWLRLYLVRKTDIIVYQSTN